MGSTILYKKLMALYGLEFAQSFQAAGEKLPPPDEAVQILSILHLQRQITDNIDEYLENTQLDDIIAYSGLISLLSSTIDQLVQYFPNLTDNEKALAESFRQNWLKRMETSDD